ncbi:hypothetical protein Tco_0869813 [Tanacetum coccineum]
MISWDISKREEEDGFRYNGGVWRDDNEKESNGNNQFIYEVGESSAAAVLDHWRRDTDESRRWLDREQSRDSYWPVRRPLGTSYGCEVIFSACIGLCHYGTTVHAQMSEIIELQSADHSRQRAISDLLKTDRERREEMRELRAADRTRQQQIIQTLTVMQTLQRYAPQFLHRCQRSQSYSQRTVVDGERFQIRLCYRDSRDPLGVLHSQSCQRRLVAVLRLDFVMASRFVFSLLCITGNSRLVGL